MYMHACQKKFDIIFRKKEKEKYSCKDFENSLKSVLILQIHSFIEN